MFDLHIYSSKESLKAAVLLSLLSVWVLVGLFYYLNKYTRRRYFTIWTAAWLFYALWITLSFGMRMQPPPAWKVMIEMWCIGVSAVFLFWGSEHFVGERVRQRLIGFFIVFLLVWSYVVANFGREPQNSLWIAVPLFGLIGVASFVTARSFFQFRRRRGYIGATLLTVGFVSWGVYMISYPFLQKSLGMVSVALFMSAVIQLLVAVSMIILVLEEFRETHQLAVEQIHLRKRERDELQTRVDSTEERYRTLFEKAGEAIVITDAETLQILELNHAAEHLLAVKRAEASEHTLVSFCALKIPADWTPTGDEWFELLRQQHPLSIIRKDGGQIKVEIDGTRINFGTRPAFQFFVREMTERSRLEQQLRQAEKLSALGQMISGIAHELNNPLAVIKGYVELILSHHELAPQTRTNLEKVGEESNRATKLVRNFLSFAREQPMRRDVVHFNDIIRQVVELQKLDLKTAGVECLTELDPALPQTAADSDQVKQLLTNLITNAAQAMADHPAPRRLKLVTRQRNQAIQIAVEDNGPGVPPELLTKIFEPFFTTKQVGRGTGLGLSIAHSIMTEHKGRIFYEKSSMGGAAFVLEFPMAAANLAAALADVPAPETAVAKAPKPADVPSSQVLVLDDERALAEMLSELLDILGHKPTKVHSAEEALEVIEKQDFDLIISDFRMPGMNGQQFFEVVKAKHPALSRRIIFLTGDLVNEETKAFLESVGNPHLEKPFNLSTVKKAVNEVLSAGLAAQA